MGILTDDMTRLVGEIVDLRRGRGAFMKDLARETKEMEDSVSVMRAGFLKSHGGMARRLKANLKAFNRNLKSSVKNMEAGFNKAHSAMARKTRAERQAFVADLNEAGAGLRQEFASDLSGARRAWQGQGA